MIRFFKKAGLICVAASVICCTAYADINTSQDGSSVKISGVTESEKTEKNVIANVLAPSKSYDELLKAEIAEYGNIVVYHNQTKTTDKGEFEFTVDMTDKPSGLYLVNVTDSGTADLIYTDMEKNSAAIEWLAGLDKSPNKSEFKAKQADLGFYGGAYKLADEDELLDLIYASVKDGEFDFGASVSDLVKRDSAITVFEKLTVISALNSENIENIFDYAHEIGLADSDVSEYLTLSFCSKSNFINNMTKRLSGNNFANKEEFDEGLLEAFILAAVRYPDGYNNLTGLLNDFKSEIGLKKNVTATAASNISGNNYNDYDELALAINGSGSGSSSGLNGGSSGGGGSYGGSSNKTPDLQIGTEIITESDATEYHVDVFTDLGNVEWARDAIVYLAELDIVHGDGKFKFNPENNVTREEFTKMVVQAFAPETEEAEILFTDVSESDWFAPYIKKAKGLGIINGQSETIFGAGQNITRQDMAVIACNAAKMYGITFSEDGKTLFEDDEVISDYAKSSVYELRAGEILTGKENNMFCPTENATRAEAAKIIYGLLEM